MSALRKGKTPPILTSHPSLRGSLSYVKECMIDAQHSCPSSVNFWPRASSIFSDRYLQRGGNYLRPWVSEKQGKLSNRWFFEKISNCLDRSEDLVKNVTKGCERIIHSPTSVRNLGPEASSALSLLPGRLESPNPWKGTAVLGLGEGKWNMHILYIKQKKNAMLKSKQEWVLPSLSLLIVQRDTINLSYPQLLNTSPLRYL